MLLSIQRSRIVFFFALTWLFIGGHIVLNRPLMGGDWPQILGPDRNGVATDETLATQWPADGPPLLWKRTIGRGYAGVAVQKDRAILFYRADRAGKDEEVLEAVRLGDGRSLWKLGWKAHFTPTIFPAEDGPLCVPLIHEDRVFAFGGGGDLVAAELESGRLIWSRDLYRQYRQRGGTIDFGYFGAGSSPILHGDRLLVNVGGRAEAGIIAINCDNGKNN